MLTDTLLMEQYNLPNALTYHLHHMHIMNTCQRTKGNRFLLTQKNVDMRGNNDSK